MNMNERKIYYISKRERFNDLKINGNEAINIEKAVLMIFLNKTCFNGLFRVNKKGLLMFL
ncbi:DNA adenine methylase [Campylobacter jejuni]|uniref:DNA adenine methylase n=1 Tax=Campylobacter jejuni TaxID=197 RepID=UPI003364BCE6